MRWFTYRWQEDIEQALSVQPPPCHLCSCRRRRLCLRVRPGGAQHRSAESGLLLQPLATVGLGFSTETPFLSLYSHFWS